MADAGYFTNGWGMVAGDEIQLEGSAQRARITDVDYGNNLITVDRTMSWTQDIGVSLAYEGSAPDLGAHEYGETGIRVPGYQDTRDRTALPSQFIYSYPSRDKCIIRLKELSTEMIDGSKLKIYDLSGRLVAELTSGQGEFHWNTGSVLPGIYSMEWEGEGIFGMHKFLLVK